MMIDYFTNGLKGAYTAYTEQLHGIQDNLLKCVYFNVCLVKLHETFTD